MSRAIWLALGFGAFALGGCIDSDAPILTESRPVVGERLQMMVYTLRDGGITADGEGALFTWDGTRYKHIAGALSDVGAFTVQPFEDSRFIVQTMPWDHARGHEYALMQAAPFMVGAYVLVPIDEEDADEATRKANCEISANHACRIKTAEQLFALARATAVKPHTMAVLATLRAAAPPK